MAANFRVPDTASDKRQISRGRIYLVFEKILVESLVVDPFFGFPSISVGYVSIFIH